VELYDGAAGGAGLARLALPAASGGDAAWCERLGLLAEALEVLRAAGEHHRRCRHFRCGTLIERDPAVAGGENQLVLGARQVVAMTGHSADSTPPGRDSRTLACGAIRSSAKGRTERVPASEPGTYWHLQDRPGFFSGIQSCNYQDVVETAFPQLWQSARSRAPRGERTV
jgi:hypothetical protein